MNPVAVVALASVLPDGESIEAFNRSIYDGLRVSGSIADTLLKPQALVAALLEQLQRNNSNTPLVKEKQVYVFVSDRQEDFFSIYPNAVVCKNLVSALQQVTHLLQKDFDQVHVFAIEISKQDIAAEQQVRFAQQQDFSLPQASQVNGGLAFSFQLHKKGVQHLALLEAFSVANNISEAEIENSIQRCLQQSAYAVNEIGYLELTAFVDERMVEKELRACKVAYQQNSTELHIALGSVASSLAYPSPLFAVASFTKLVLLCYHRYLAAVPGWTGPKFLSQWQDACFYVCSESKSWFVNDVDTPRVAALSLFNESESTYAHVLISDRGVSLERQSRYFSYACPHCAPFAGNSAEELLRGIENFKQALFVCQNEMEIRALAKQAYQFILDEEDALNIKSYRAVMLGENKEQLLAEIALFQSGIEKAFEDKTKIHWEFKTPKGSYFTAKPLGEGGKVAFVFPGLGSSYVGLGQDIFQLFPSIFKESFRFTKNVGEELQEKVLYPRRQHALSFKEKRQLDMDIVMNLKDVGKTDTTYSSICAHIMTHVFQVQPDMAFGYSMGEANMMTALEAWKQPTLLEGRFRQSEIFKNKLYGRLETVRKIWNVDSSIASEHLWSTFTLKASQPAVADCISSEKLHKVFITLINTDDNVVIAGETFSCLHLIQKLACRAIPMGFVPAIHCPPTYEEYEGIAALYTLETNDACSSKLYSSSCYLPVPFRSKAIAYAIAKCFCEPVDFPRLVDRVYQDGARIFLEAGAGRTCSTWIDKILADREHVIVPLNVKGTPDSLTFARVLAKLFCHKVDVNLHPLYENIS